MLVFDSTYDAETGLIQSTRRYEMETATGEKNPKTNTETMPEIRLVKQRYVRLYVQ